MPRASKAPSMNSTNLAQVRQELLAPIASFLVKSGLSQKQLLMGFRSALRHASASKLRVTHLQIGEQASSIVNRWLRDPAYLNAAGRPIELSLNGSRSISTLIKASQSTVSPRAAAKMLMEFGIVKRVALGRYRLVRRFVNFGHLRDLPFEPNFKFLVDATKVSTSRLPNASGQPGLFWHCADNSRIDARRAKEFLRFAQQRSLSFMHEINDWLDVHEYKGPQPKGSRIKLKRVGIGLFGISR